MTRPWFTFYSQSGNELRSLIDTIGYWPTVIITNKDIKDVRADFQSNTSIITIPKNPTINDWERLIERLKLFTNTEEPLVTLHGFLRILPKEFINAYPDCYNGHPGLIDPQLTSDPNFLKGKDPQQKAFNARLKYSGCVIHKVTSIVDDGKIVASKQVLIEGMPLDEVFSVLGKTSFELWSSFLRNRLH